MINKTCKTCQNCRPSYKGGWCGALKKKVKYSGTCDKWQGKRELTNGQDRIV